LTAWSTAEVNDLIHIYGENGETFLNYLLKKKDVWKSITAQLNSSGGVQYSWEEVAKKWSNLKNRLNVLVTFLSANWIKCEKAITSNACQSKITKD